MLCLDCSLNGQTNQAVGLCHHCSAALCSTHANVIDHPVTTTYLVAKPVQLPRHARLILCRTCLIALQQNREPASDTSLTQR